MSRWFRLLLLIALALSYGCARAASTYTFRSDSYAWETAANAITWDKTCTGYPGDDDKATITLTGGFKFRFASTDYTSVRVLANGGLQFGTDTGFFRTFTNTALPAGTPAAQSGCTATATTNVILAYWTDLNPSASGSGGVTWEQKGTAPNRYLVVSWNGVYQYSTTTPYTFQIILYESASGVNGEFKYQYGNANATGSKATIGVQIDSSDYTQYSYNSGYNANGSAIRWFVPSGTPTRRAEYRFDEYSYSGRVGEVLDSSGGSNNGVRVGSATTVASPRVVCRSLSIPADASSASHAVDTLLDVNSGIGDTGAVTFWYYANAAWNSGAAMLLDATTSTSKPFFLVRQSDGSLRFTAADSTGVLISAVTAAQTGGAATWKHIGVTWKLASGSNQSVVRIYINGSQVGATTGTTTGGLDNSIGTLFVGDNRSSPAPTNATLASANGYIDEMRVYNYEISALELTADMNPAHTCPPPLDHYEVWLPSASLTCLPTTVTVKACSTNAATCSVETTVNGTATLTTNAGTLANTLLSFSNGVATTTLSLPGGADNTVATLTLSAESTSAANARQCCPDGASCYPSNSCPTTFKRSGFIVASTPATATNTGGAAITLPTQVAGTASSTYYLRAVKSGTSTQVCEAALTGNRNVNWGYQCNDPTTCGGSNLMSVNGTAIASNANGVSTATAAVPMTFDGYGNAPFTLTFADVGKTALFFNYATNALAGIDISGTGNAFVTRPAKFLIDNAVTPGGVVNPASSSSTPGVFVAAGALFNARVTAQTSGGAATPNFGKEAAPEGVLLAANLVEPVGGNPGTLGGNTTVAGTAFTNGVAAVTGLTYSEVGLMSITGTIADTNYLGGGNVPTPTLPLPASNNIGRFTPAGFTVVPVASNHRVAQACPAASAFTYLDESFSVNFTLAAVNAQGVTTQNYAGNTYARFDLATTNFNLAGSDTTNAVTTKLPSSRLTVASAGAWPAVGNAAAGTASVTLTVTPRRLAAPDGPFDNTLFGIAPLDQDNVGMRAFDLDADPAIAGNDHTRVHPGQIPLRYGRLRLQNALSAANRALKLPLSAQYWNGGIFVNNALDSCTRITDTNLSFGNFRKTLTSADAVMNPNAVTVDPANPVYITLAAPGGGRLGSMDVTVALGSTSADASCLKTASGWTASKAATAGANLASLRGAWCGNTATSDPSARATWGLFRGSDGVVYQRENY
ncbi:DUF6701 domain-containing protein [Roseateles sp. NT4]|uniref:DUF6701 domain-containing protein n=1 Tax=Roseateles sp. NT4 TaxID=3453715 RepID=UPI003EE91B88